jgi:hypothetical protein
MKYLLIYFIIISSAMAGFSIERKAILVSYNEETAKLKKDKKLFRVPLSWLEVSARREPASYLNKEIKYYERERQ